jgi:hypothetical protein
MGWTVLWWVIGLWAAALAVFTLVLWRGHQKRMGGTRYNRGLP